MEIKDGWCFIQIRSLHKKYKIHSENQYIVIVFSNKTTEAYHPLYI